VSKWAGVIALLLSHQTLRFGLGILDHEFVAGGAAGVLAGEDDQRTVLGKMALAAADRFFVKRGRVEIPMNSFQIAKARRFQTMADILL